MNAHNTAEVVGAYHDAWTRKDYAQARALLAGTLAVEVPVNDYPTAESFAAALESFGSMVSNVELLAAMSDGNQAMLLYDLEAGPVGRLRVAEHFTVEGGKITRIRQIHDTAAVRAAGVAGGGRRALLRQRKDRHRDSQTRRSRYRLRPEAHHPGGTRAGVRRDRHPRRPAPLVDGHRHRLRRPPAARCASASQGWMSRSSCASTWGGRSPSSHGPAWHTPGTTNGPPARCDSGSPTAGRGLAS